MKIATYVLAGTLILAFASGAETQERGAECLYSILKRIVDANEQASVAALPATEFAIAKAHSRSAWTGAEYLQIQTAFQSHSKLFQKSDMGDVDTQIKRCNYDEERGQCAKGIHGASYAMGMAGKMFGTLAPIVAESTDHPISRYGDHMELWSQAFREFHTLSQDALATVHQCLNGGPDPDIWVARLDDAQQRLLRTAEILDEKYD